MYYRLKKYDIIVEGEKLISMEVFLWGQILYNIYLK